MMRSYYTWLLPMLLLTACADRGEKPAAAVGEQATAAAPLSERYNLDSLSQGHAFVDLGICHHLQWATTNLGASRPEEAGPLYQWGVTHPIDCHNTYWPNYRYYLGVSEKDGAIRLSKYNTNQNQFEEFDNLITLQPQDDAAHVQWGGGWRMPDAAELDSLLRLCEWQPDTLNGKPGFRVSGRRKGYEDHSIFLPHTGAVDGLSLYHPEKNGYYWSRNILDQDAFKNGIGMLTNKENLSTTFYYRYIAQAIRPVFLPGETLVRQVVLGERIKKIELQAGSFRMQATVLPSEASNQRLHWASSDGRIAHVDSVGTVTLLRDGTCYISATSTDGTSCTSTMMLQIIDPEHPQHEYVDLGICNHLWWATMNVGAASAEEPGDYFDFQQARKIYWGDHWRLPTDAEIDSLLTRCEWQWTTQNGQTGYLVTNNTVEGYRQTSIFLPAAGKMSEQGLMRWGKAGFYWSGTELPDVEGTAINLAFGMQSPIWNYCRQSERMTVRLVYSRK